MYQLYIHRYISKKKNSESLATAQNAALKKKVVQKRHTVQTKYVRNSDESGHTRKSFFGHLKPVNY